MGNFMNFFCGDNAEEKKYKSVYYVSGKPAKFVFFS